jgi:NAD(P)-dependent dehydrogenase (short-subunit alcohol dehydrogenase family)
MKELAGKVAVVTGGAGGIGKAIGEAFVAQGVKVVLADVLKEPLEAAVADIGSDDLIGVVTDVTSYDSLCAVRAAAVDRFGGMHIVVNNAGVGAGAKGHMWEHHLKDWQWSMDVNVMGVINGIKAFVPHLVAQNEGHVVNTSSGNGGFTPMSATGIYPVTKAAVVTLTECLWGQLRDLGSEVSASVLFPSTKTPGVMATGIWNAGANRPDRYLRGDPDDQGSGRDALREYIDRAKEAGEEVPIAPLSEVADLCVDAVRNDNFWGTYSREEQDDKLRARVKSQIEQTSPDYLLGPNLMAKSASERDDE